MVVDMNSEPKSNSKQKKLIYKCPGCNDEFTNWSNCLDHVRKSPHDSSLGLFALSKTKIGRRQLQEICKVKMEISQPFNKERSPDDFLNKLPFLQDKEWESVLASLY